MHLLIFSCIVGLTVTVEDTVSAAGEEGCAAVVKVGAIFGGSMVTSPGTVAAGTVPDGVAETDFARKVWKRTTFSEIYCSL